MVDMPLKQRNQTKPIFGKCPCGMVGKVLDCNNEVSKLKLQPCNHVHFQTNTLGEKYEPPYPQAMG